MTQPGIVFMLSFARAGSHFLGSILGQHEGVHYADEVFNYGLANSLPASFQKFLSAHIADHPDWQMSQKYAQGLFAEFLASLREQHRDSTVVIDLKVSQLRLLDWPPWGVGDLPHLIARLVEGRFPVIYLSRQDLLAQAASLQLAFQTGRWFSSADEAPRPTQRIRLERDRLLWGLEQIAASDALVRSWINGRLPVAWLTYETMMRGNRLSDQAISSIVSATGIRLAADISTRTGKASPPLRDLVENFDEVLDMLSGTRFAWLTKLHRPG